MSELLLPSHLKSDLVTARIVKGDMGFGFTIADSKYGQTVKKILDRRRCKDLLEGDILFRINGIDVSKMSHAEIVDVLRDCPVGQEAIVSIQRGGTLRRNIIKEDTAYLVSQKPVSCYCKKQHRCYVCKPPKKTATVLLFNFILAFCAFEAKSSS